MLLHNGITSLLFCIDFRSEAADETTLCLMALILEYLNLYVGLHDQKSCFLILF